MFLLAEPVNQILLLKRAGEDIDKQVLIRLRNGDVHAFQKIFDRYSENLFYFIQSYLKDSFEAEEIVQDVFLRIWEMRSDIDEEKSFKNLLFRMAVNRVLNSLKRKVVRRKYEDYLTNFGHSLHESPEEQVHFQELHERIEYLIQQLPEQQRNLFKMSRISGMSNAEIAEKLGLSIRTVENQIYRAGKFLKENLKDEYLFLLFCLLYFL